MTVAPTHNSQPPRGWQSKAMRYKWLSWFWLFPSAGAACILALAETSWWHAPTWRRMVEALRLEQWIALAILLVQGVLVALAIYHRRVEPLQPRLDPETHPERAEPSGHERRKAEAPVR